MLNLPKKLGGRKFMGKGTEEVEKQTDSELLKSIMEFQEIIHEIQLKYGTPMNFIYTQKIKGGKQVCRIEFHITSEQKVDIKCPLEQFVRKLKDDIIPRFKKHKDVVVPVIVGGAI